MSRTPRRGRTGQSLAEFALLAPFLTFLLAGVAQFAFLYYASITVDTAAREGARVAVEQPQTSGAFNASGAATGTVTCTFTSSGYGPSGNSACAAISANRGALTPSTATITSINPSSGAVKCSTSSVTTGPADGFITVSVNFKPPIFVPFLQNMLQSVSTNGLTESTTMRVVPCGFTNGS